MNVHLIRIKKNEVLFDVSHSNRFDLLMQLIDDEENLADVVTLFLNNKFNIKVWIARPTYRRRREQRDETKVNSEKNKLNATMKTENSWTKWRVLATVLACSFSLLTMLSVDVDKWEWECAPFYFEWFVFCSRSRVRLNFLFVISFSSLDFFSFVISSTNSPLSSFAHIHTSSVHVNFSSASQFSLYS